MRVRTGAPVRMGTWGLTIENIGDGLAALSKSAVGLGQFGSTLSWNKKQLKKLVQPCHFH